MTTSPAIRPSVIKGHISWQATVKCYLQYQKVMNRKLAQLNLTAAQHELLMYIAKNPGHSQQQLSAYLMVVKSNSSALLKKLERLGLIEKRRHQQDARQYQLYLTSQGQNKLKQSMSVHIEVIQTITDSVSESALEANLNTMHRLISALELLE